MSWNPVPPRNLYNSIYFGINVSERVKVHVWIRFLRPASPCQRYGERPVEAPAPPFAKLTLTIPGALLFRRGIHEAYIVYIPTYIYARNCIPGLHAFPKTVPGGICARAHGEVYIRGAFRFADVRHIKYSRMLRRVFSPATVSRVAIFASARPRGPRDFRKRVQRGADGRCRVTSGAARKTPAAAVSGRSFLRISAYARPARPNKFTYSYVRCDTSHLSFVFRCTARLFRRYGTVRNMGRYLPVFPSASDRGGGEGEYVDLCARSETSFYLSFHGMDVKVEETWRAAPASPSPFLYLSEYRIAPLAHLVSSRLIPLVRDLWYRWHIGSPPVSAAYVRRATSRRGVKPDRLVGHSTNPGASRSFDQLNLIYIFSLTFRFNILKQTAVCPM